MGLSLTQLPVCLYEDPAGGGDLAEQFDLSQKNFFICNEM